MTIHHTLYKNLTMLIPTLPEVPEYAKSDVPGLMDLNVDLLSRNGETIKIALNHYYEQNGDLIDRAAPTDKRESVRFDPAR